MQVWKKNDARKIIQRKSNHTDDPAEILRAEFRINALKHRERKPRKYTKKYSEYWQTNIKEKRKARKRISYDKVPEVLLNEAPPVILLLSHLPSKIIEEKES